MGTDIILTKGQRVMCITPPRKKGSEFAMRFVPLRLYRRQIDNNDDKYMNLLTSFREPEIELLVYSESLEIINDYCKFYQQARWLTQKQFEECFMVI
jgi:hypothetical protein